MRSLKLVLAILLLTTYPHHHNSRAFAIQQQNQCVSCHRDIDRLYKTSVHHKLSPACTFCHGGDASQTDKVKAHSGFAFSQGIARRCGDCHVHQLAMFNSSRHNPATRNAPRIDCVDCHGIHTVGAPPADFVFSNICASCHGLEYLPALPAPFIELLKLSDELRRREKQLEGIGVTLPRSVAGLRDGVKAGTGTIVHSTDRDGGLAEIPRLLKQGELVKGQIDALLHH
jgi:hypothetical protein